ncbi:sugar ABC transporter ATP-binding protein [Sporanaerobium hydrogeniformans]|uniref:Sugar ABC transporter ATP-binding protein n=1 Tax=Sporanaerobium hydrogeniformans TaxID=3072179 RepID=A0AC61DBW1_9FIRM|nr:carbohydrate ABC transporter permease [Sporanaerobium hydrogeniformans]PHV70052.1 sugar ABC transporter ATP-binding protein [Sporanaerobium hydrogeniformans]
METVSYKKIISKVVVYTLLLLLLGVALIPFLWMLSASLKANKDVFSFPIQWIPHPIVWENYIEIWKKIPLITFILNTMKLTIIITVLQVVTSSLASYGFAKLEFKGRDLLFLCYVSTIAIPWQVYMIPQYLIIQKMNLVDSHWSLIILQAFSAFGVFLMRQFLISIPKELSEAAKIDGLSEFGIFGKIMMPLAKPGLATLTIFTFVTIWNDFMGPLIYLNSTDKKTIQLGLRLFITQFSAEYSLIMAASIVTLVPVLIVFLSLQKYFVEGIATSGLKG